MEEKEEHASERRDIRDKGRRRERKCYRVILRREKKQERKEVRRHARGGSLGEKKPGGKMRRNA